MKNFTIRENRKINGVSNYFVAPHPTHMDLFSAVNYFNKENREIENGTIFLDLIALVGNRDNRFISAEVNDYLFDVNTIKVIDFYNELEDFTKESYSKLADSKIKMIYPILFRNDIIARKNKEK